MILSFVFDEIISHVCKGLQMFRITSLNNFREVIYQ